LCFASITSPPSITITVNKSEIKNLENTQNLGNSRSSLSHNLNLTYLGQNHHSSTAVTNKFKPSHSRTRSDQTGLFNNSNSNSRSTNSHNLKATIGDLMSGRAFDNNCNCIDQQLENLTLNSKGPASNISDSDHPSENVIEFNLNGISEENRDNDYDSSQNGVNLSNLTNNIDRKFECLCNAPRLAPEFEFTKSLISIGKKLIRLATKELKSI